MFRARRVPSVTTPRASSSYSALFPVLGIQVMEEEEAHKIVGRVKATDKDTEPVNREVIYSIQNYNPSHPFRATEYLSIGTFDGIIRTKRPIDREKVESLVFTVSARNKAPLVHATKGTTESIVHVTILDRNDNKPMLKSNDQNKVSFVLWRDI